MNLDEKFMLRCLELARLGLGFTSPNPMVGCVIVNNKGKIIGEGYHQKCGENHAEVNAINNVKNKAELKFSTLYVSLEPCSHFGKTPPCSDLIIQYQIPKVVIGCQDPHSKVNGKGIARLKNANIEVVVDILEKKCIELNKRFFSFHKNKRPYVILKWAQTKDHFIDVKRTSEKQGINWITSKTTKQLTHSWRAEEDAIMVGKNTVINDNPSLTTREVVGKNPTRFIIDPSLTLNKELKIFTDEHPLYVLNCQKNESKGKINYLKFNPEKSIEGILDLLSNLNIQSVIIEGGATTINHFINTDCWDEARVLTGNKYFTNGLKAPNLSMQPESNLYLGEDEITIFKNT